MHLLKRLMKFLVALSVALHLPVLQLVLTRLDWIQRQQAKFAGREPPQPRQFITGEAHYFQGQRYLLNVVDWAGPTRIELRDAGIIQLSIRGGSDTSQREKVFQDWSRQQLKRLIPPLLAKWEAMIGVQVAQWNVKQMKTKWGTCNIKARRIWLSLELVKRSPSCLEFVIVHELVHLLERQHNARFYGYMDRFLPQWRVCREELKQAALGHET